MQNNCESGCLMAIGFVLVSWLIVGAIVLLVLKIL
jgi:hypothetical protein